jgi:DNA invertase Pin-like site-specific DNA recombinase
MVEHVNDGAGDDLADLHFLDDLQRQVADAVDVVARRLLEQGASYREVGVALGISRQAAARRYPTASARRAGGQPGGLR